MFRRKKNKEPKYRDLTEHPMPEVPEINHPTTQREVDEDDLKLEMIKRDLLNALTLINELKE